MKNAARIILIYGKMKKNNTDFDSKYVSMFTGNPINDRPLSACSLYEATCMSGDCIPKSAICNGVAGM